MQEVRLSKVKNYDVIIIGAGPSGIFCAYELIHANKDLKILMIEKGRSIENRRVPSQPDSREQERSRMVSYLYPRM